MNFFRKPAPPSPRVLKFCCRTATVWKSPRRLFLHWRLAIALTVASKQPVAGARPQPRGVRGLFQRRVVQPVVDLLRVGASPRRLAWSLAVGVAVGVNPVLGSTTLACLLIAFVLRLNLVASQITNHLVYPLQLALFFVYLRLGDMVFHTGALPLGRDELLHAFRHHPLGTTRMLWTWEWHAILVWLVFAMVGTPLLAWGLTPVLRRALVRLHHAEG